MSPEQRFWLVVVCFAGAWSLVALSLLFGDGGDAVTHASVGSVVDSFFDRVLSILTPDSPPQPLR